MTTDAERIADEIERALNVLDPISSSDILFSAPNAAPGCELRFSTLRKSVTALRAFAPIPPTQADWKRCIRPECRINGSCGWIDDCVAPPAAPSPNAQSELVERIDAALKRIKDGHAPMRVPVDPTDVDVVLSACKGRITELEQRIRELDAKLLEKTRQEINARITLEDRAAGRDNAAQRGT